MCVCVWQRQVRGGEAMQGAPHGETTGRQVHRRERAPGQEGHRERGGDHEAAAAPQTPAALRRL